MENTKSVIISGVIVLVAVSFGVLKQIETNRTSYENISLRLENNILSNEIRALETQPNYEDGYRDAIIKIGGPQSAGSYQDGWNAAVKVIASNTYAEGYHTAIKQFGYTKEGSKWLIDDSIPSTRISDIPNKEPKK